MKPESIYTTGNVTITESPNAMNDNDVSLEDNASIHTTTTSASASAPVHDVIASSPPSLARILAVAKPEWPGLVVALVVMIASEAMGLISPLVIALAYDALVDETTDDDDRMNEINQAMLLVMILHFSGIVTGFIRHALLGVIGERLVARLRNQLYAAILKQEIAFFDEHKSGELVSRLGSDTTLLQNATSQSMPEFVLGIIKLFVSVALMFWISVKLAGLTLGFVLLVFLIALPFGSILGKLSKEYQDVLGEAQTRSTESLGAMRTVQSFAAEEREQLRYQDKIGNPDEVKWWIPTNHNGHKPSDDDNGTSKTTYRVGFYKAIWNSGFFTFIFGFGFAAMYASLWYGFKLVVDGEMSIGGLTAFQSYIFQIGFGLGGISAHLSKVLEALGASGRIFYLMDRIPTIPTPPGHDNPEDANASNNDISLISPPPPVPLLQPESMEGAVTLKNVSFSYPSRGNSPVLENFSLYVPPNTTAALVGSSGAGKSTVVALLQRFYDVNSGSIQIDGRDIRTLDLAWLRRHIGYVQVSRRIRVIQWLCRLFSSSLAFFLQLPARTHTLWTHGAREYLLRRHRPRSDTRGGGRRVSKSQCPRLYQSVAQWI
jgi:ABC-type multidrug transport system fused ATPase/permease subunit